MTAQPRSEQRELIERLTSAPLGSRVLVTAPAGIGLSAALAEVAADAVRRGEAVVVVVPNRMLLDQWTERLRRAGVERVSELGKATEAIMALDEGEGEGLAQPGVLVASVQVLRHRTGRRVGALLSPSLLILELPSINVRPDDGSGGGTVDEAITEVLSHSQRVIVATNARSDVPWLVPTETVTVSLAQALAQGPADVTVLVATHVITPAEAELITEGQRLIGAVGGSLPIRMSTRPALYGTLLRVAARLSGEAFEVPDDLDDELTEAAPPTPPPGLVEDVWRVLDRLEALEGDSRLELVVHLVTEALEADRPVLILTDRQDETEYVAGGLKARGLPVSVVTGSTERSERRRRAEEFGPGTVLVTTRAILELLKQPTRTEQIWWSPARTISEATQRLTRSADQGRVVALVADPPQPDDRRVLAVFEQLKSEAGLNVVPLHRSSSAGEDDTAS